jgi:hypothetical protein
MNANKERALQGLIQDMSVDLEVVKLIVVQLVVLMTKEDHDPPAAL